MPLRRRRDDFGKTIRVNKPAIGVPILLFFAPFCEGEKAKNCQENICSYVLTYDAFSEMTSRGRSTEFATIHLRCRWLPHVGQTRKSGFQYKQKIPHIRSE